MFHVQCVISSIAVATECRPEHAKEEVQWQEEERGALHQAVGQRGRAGVGPAAREPKD